MGHKRTLNRPATRISLRDCESAAQRVDFILQFVEGKAESRESPGLFSPKSNSTRGCNRRRDALEDVRRAICESRVARVWYGPTTWERPIPAPKVFEKPCVRPVALGARHLASHSTVNRFRAEENGGQLGGSEAFKPLGLVWADRVHRIGSSCLPSAYPEVERPNRNRLSL